MADAYTIILGNNEITNCDAALVIEGEEVFRIREEENGALMIDCDIRDQDGTRIAQIAQNSVVFAADGFRARLAPGQPAEVIRKATGEVMAKIERLGRARSKLRAHSGWMGLTWWRRETASSLGVRSSAKITSEDGEPPSSWDAGRLGLVAWRVALETEKAHDRHVNPCRVRVMGASPLGYHATSASCERAQGCSPGESTHGWLPVEARMRSSAIVVLQTSLEGHGRDRPRCSTAADMPTRAPPS